MKFMLVATVVFLAIVGCKEEASIEPVSVAAASAVAPAPSASAPPPVASAVPVKTSLCSELDRWTKELVDSSAAAEQVQPRYKAKNQEANGAIELIRISGSFSRETAAKAEALQRRVDDLQALDLDPKEVPVRDQLLKGFKATTTVFQRYSEAFHDGTKGLPMLIKIGQAITGLTQLSKKLDVDLHKQCAGT